MILFRHADPRFPFLWESSSQPPARWHGTGEGPVQYLADTPTGAWAEFLRHEEIRDQATLATVSRAIWAVEVSTLPRAVPTLTPRVLTGGLSSHVACQAEARRLRRRRVRGLRAPSAALLPGAASGWRVDGGLQAAGPRDGAVVVLFGRRPTLVGWRTAAQGRPDPELLNRVRHF